MITPVIPLNLVQKVATAEPLLRAEHVTLEYAGERGIVRATDDVSFDVHRGDRFVLLGPSGCGKSTLLKAIGGFIAPRAGSLSLSGKPITGPGPDRIVVFQEFDQLPPWKTVRQNVMFPMLAGGVARVVQRVAVGAVPAELRLQGDAGPAVGRRPARDVEQQPVQRAADQFGVDPAGSRARPGVVVLLAVDPAPQQLLVPVHTPQRRSRH